ncbi:MAG: carbohydrate-binding protein [Lentisphaeria bacterium]|nr:carbohydrate-binding protein [Lentisphaeria bacterium]
MRQALSRIFLAVMVVGVWGAAEGTRLASGDMVLFQSPVAVTFGARYTAHAVRATLVAPAEAVVEIRVERLPKGVFLNEEPLPATAWRAADGMVSLTVPAGTSELQIRFDEVASVKPFSATVPVVLVGEQGARPLGELELRVANERARGVLSWPGPAGFYRMEARRGEAAVAGVSIGLAGAPEAEFAGAPAFYVEPGNALTVAAEVPNFQLPLDRFVARAAAVCAETAKIDKGSQDWKGSVAVEGEAFAAQGGGEVRVSTEHQNTSGGACAFGWANPGHWVEWTLEVAQAGDYALTILGASQEKVVLRAAELDGKPLAGAGVIRMAGTGGWGRTNPDDWQPFRVLGEAGQPLAIALTPGKHTLRLTNLVGQHYNVDAILLTPLGR